MSPSLATATTPPSHEGLVQRLRPLLGLVPFALLVLAAWTIHRELVGFHFKDLQASVVALPGGRLWLALGVTLASYGLLTLYDLLALRHLGSALPYPNVALTSFIAYAFGHNIGFSMLSAGAVRYRLYSGWGLSSVQITQVIALCGATLWVGFCCVAGFAAVLAPAVPLASSVPQGLVLALGLLLLLVPAAWLLVTWKVRRPLTFRHMTFMLPGPRIAAAQLLVASADWVLAAAVLWCLLPPEAGLPFPSLLGLFLFAQLAGMVSQVPGGLGVFESVIVAALSPKVPAPAVLGLLVVYRLIYYVVPFVVAALLLAATEILRRREGFGRGVRATSASFAPVVPWISAAGCFLAGAVLLFSGATPTVSERLHLIAAWLPLPLLEVSHFAASIAGLSLLVVARGLQQRLATAWLAALVLLGAGAGLSVIKGGDYEEATLLCCLLLALAPFRGQFYRRSSLRSQHFTLGWFLALTAVVAASVWLGFFSYRHVDYRQELWWQFEFSGDAPRFLRASVGVVAGALLTGLSFLLRPASGRPPPAGREALALARPLIAASTEASSHLALMGDKALLFDEKRTAFVMYGVEGRSWVSMGDPVGPEKEATELAWKFFELADRHHGWACFYQVGPGSLPRYLDLGLTLVKLGEDAIVGLNDFSLDGAARSGLRQTHRKAERDGLSFEVLPPEGIPAVLPVLEEISDAWLVEKQTREKTFSLGAFEPRYLAEGPVAVVRKAGTVIGFANLWASAAKSELLDRPDARAPRCSRSDRIPAGQPDALGARTGLRSLQPGHGTVFRLRAASTGTPVESDGDTAVQPR